MPVASEAERSDSALDQACPTVHMTSNPQVFGNVSGVAADVNIAPRYQGAGIGANRFATNTDMQGIRDGEHATDEFRPAVGNMTKRTALRSQLPTKEARIRYRQPHLSYVL